MDMFLYDNNDENGSQFCWKKYTEENLSFTIQCIYEIFNLKSVYAKKFQSVEINQMICQSKFYRTHVSYDNRSRRHNRR